MLANRFLRLAVLYALFGIGLGVYMGATGQFLNRGIHVHANLVGWVSLALMGMLYRLYPQLAAHWLARWHFWLHNSGLPLMLLGLYGLFHGLSWGEPLTGAGSLLVALAFLCFGLNVLWRLDSNHTAAAQPALRGQHVASR